jgi:Kef-type K+ transport system membrane component KefB/nucleotide-binding universal stress UspA family protein
MTLPITDPAGVFSVVLAIILVAPFLAEKIRMPGIVGLALAGILVGPNGLDLIANDGTIEFLGTIGLLYVFFVAGAEIDIGQLRRERKASLLFYAFTFGIPFAVAIAAGLVFFGMKPLSAILLGCVFSSYTLVPYPIVSRLGLTRQRSVVAAVSAVILTDSTTMLILAFVARLSKGTGEWASWLQMVGVIALWAAASALILPRAAALFFKKVKPDGTIEFVFTLALVFICAFFSRLAGLEPIIGAFYAGLLLNRFIPESSVLMNRVKFIGDSLFIPFFMVYIGVLADPRLVFGDLGNLGVALLMVAFNLGAKWLAAGGAALLLGYSRPERGILFGLSVNHAAATLAAALIGYKLGLFNQAVLDGAVFLIIASCFIGPLATQRAGKRLAASCADRPGSTPKLPERILVAIANPSSIHNLVDFAFLIRGRRNEEPIYPVAVVPESAADANELAMAENLLAMAVVQGVSAGVPVMPSTRVSVNVPEGVLQAAMENRASSIVIGWHKPPNLSHAFFGSVIEQVILGSRELVVVARVTKPVNNVSQAILVLPPLVERHPGFRRALSALASFLSQTGARLAVLTLAENGQAARTALAGLRAHGPLQVHELESWKGASSAVKTQNPASCAYFLFSARPGEPAWHPAVEKLPHRLGEESPDSSLFLFYLPEESLSVPVAEAVEPPRAERRLDLFEAALEATSDPRWPRPPSTTASANSSAPPSKPTARPSAASPPCSPRSPRSSPSSSCPASSFSTPTSRRPPSPWSSSAPAPRASGSSPSRSP